VRDKGWSSWVTLLGSPVNGGFSAGNNLGIASIAAQAYLLLNSDTLVQPGAIELLLSAIGTQPQIGLVSPRLEGLDGVPQVSCFRNHSPFSELIQAAGTGFVTQMFKKYEVPLPVSDVPMQPEWTSFAGVLIRREVIEQVGLLDEGYFMYFEDVDYCRRARAAGWNILHWPQARVVHLRGKSSSVKSDLIARRRPSAYLYASRTRYFTLYYGWLGLGLANLFWLAGRSISLIRELVGHKLPHTCEYEARDIWKNWLNPLHRSTDTSSERARMNRLQ